MWKSSPVYHYGKTNTTVFLKTGCIHETYLESLVVLDDCLPGEVILVTEAFYAHPNTENGYTCARNQGLRTSCKSASEAEIKCNNKEFCHLKAVAKGHCEVKHNGKISAIGTYTAVFLIVKYRCIQVNTATVTCPLLEAPEGGHIKLPPSRSLLSVAEFECDPGLTLSGSDRRQCQGDSTWNGIQPVCSIPSSLCPQRLLVSTFNSYCYEFQLNFTKWGAAKSMCEEQNGTLVDTSVEGVVQYLGWQAEKIGFEYFHTLQKTVILLKSYNGRWTNNSVQNNIWLLPFICQYGPFYVDEQTTHLVYTTSSPSTDITVTAHSQVQVSDCLDKYLLWILIGTCGGVVLVMLMVICVLVRKLNKTKNLNQRKNINSSTPTQDNQNVTQDMDNYSTAAPVRMIPPYSTVEKNGKNKDSEMTFSLKQDENGTLDVSENTRGKPKISYLELVKGEEIDKDYYENHAALFQQNNLRDLKSKLKNSNDVGDEGINSAECPIQSELQEKRACTGRELSISCSEPNQILVIVSAYYSYYDMKDKRCHFSAGHCSTYSSREVYKKCNLQKACSFQVVEKRSSLCQTARSRYLTVLYRCRTVECPDLLPPLHGVLGFTSPARQYGSLARYTCDRGFTLAGTKTRVCQENCSWSGIQPMCSIPPEVCPTSVNPIHSYGNYCYELRPELLSYPLATQACVDSHGTLASVDTPELRAFLAWLAEDLLTGANYWVTTRQGDMQEIARSYDLTWVPATIQPTYYNMFICQYGPYNTYTPDMLDKLPNRGPGDDGTSSVSVGSYPPLNVTTGGTGQVQEDLGQDSDLVTAIVFAVLLGLLSVVLLIILAIFIRKYCKTKKEKEAEDAGDGSSWDNYSLNGGPAYRDPQTLHSTEIKNDGRNTQEEEEGDVDRECPPRAPTKKLSVQNIKALLYAQVRKIRKPRAQRDGYDDIVIQVGNSPTNENPEVPDKAPHSPVIGNPTNPITTNTVKTIALEAAAASAGIPSYANASTDSTSGSTHEYAVPVDTKHGSPYEVRNITDMSGNQYDEVPREEDYPYQVMPNGQKSNDQVSEVAQAKKPLPIPVKRPRGQAQTDSTKVDFKDNDLYYDTSE